MAVDQVSGEADVMSEPWVILTLRYGEDRRNQTAADLTEAVAQMYDETTPGMTEGDYEEHGSAWLRFGYDDGPMLVLTIKRHGEVTFEEFADQDFERELLPCRMMRNVPENHALQLLTWLAHGDVERVRSQVWTEAEGGDMSRHNSATNFPNDADGDALREIAAQGVDMSQAQLIEFAVAAPDEAAAKKVQAALGEHGYQAHVDFDEGEPDEDGEIDPDDPEFGPAWTVYVGVSMVPTYDEIMRIQADLDRIANPHGGRADGWGVMI